MRDGIKTSKERRNFMMENAPMTVADNFATPSLVREGSVVIVDDSIGDAMYTEEVIDVLQPQFQAQILTSGEDLVAYLRGQDLFSDRSRYPYPVLVLLDLEMPEMDGFEVLQWLRDQPAHAEVPIVVLSGWSNMAPRVTRACQLGARSFLPKPVQPHDIRGVLSLLNISI
jgi:CheY-like chemotaxis protein